MERDWRVNAAREAAALVLIDDEMRAAEQNKPSAQQGIDDE